MTRYMSVCRVTRSKVKRRGHGDLKCAKMVDFKVYLVCRYARNEKTNGEL